MVQVLLPDYNYYFASPPAIPFIPLMIRCPVSGAEGEVYVCEVQCASSSTIILRGEENGCDVTPAANKRKAGGAFGASGRTE